MDGRLIKTLLTVIMMTVAMTGEGTYRPTKNTDSKDVTVAVATR